MMCARIFDKTFDLSRIGSTVQSDSDEDPDVGVDNTDKLRDGMTNTLPSLWAMLTLTVSRES